MPDRFRIYNNENKPLSGWFTARQVVDCTQPEGFRSDWSIEWFTNETSRGIVTYDQVKRFADGGPLCLPEECLAGKDKLSLQEWEQRFSVTAGTHASGCRFVPDEFNDSRPYLFLLTDHIVSSVTAGTIWLVKRQSIEG